MDMTPTSRNTLMIGGALIVIALLLTCGPWKNLLGGGDRAGETLPSVAAAPPVEAEEILPTAGAVAGDQPDDIDVSTTAGAAGPQVAPIVVAGAAAGAGVAAATASSTSSSTSSPAPPAASAGVPDTPVAAVIAPNPAVLAAAAALAAVSAFDDAFDGGDAVFAAGSAVDRFPPPVAAGGPALALVAASQPFGTLAGSIRQPCDSPGAGCQRITANSMTNPPIISMTNPPIIPGNRPGSAISNPPIIPGIRPSPPIARP
jgi:hypothetical protein